MAMLNRLLLPLAALPLLLTACGSATSTDTGSDPTDDATSTSAPTATSSAAEDPVLIVSDLGGYVPATFLASAPASLVITADGHVFVPGATTAIYPGPLLAPIATGQLDPDALQALLDRAEDDGLLADPAQGAYDDLPPVTDMPTMTVTLATDAGTFEHSAYALGFDEEKGARAVLSSFVDSAIEVATEAATETLEPTALVVSSWQQTSDQSADGSDTTVVAWPEGGAALSQGACQVVTDPDAVAAIVDADQATVFTQGTQRFVLGARIVVPGDRGCPETKSP